MLIWRYICIYAGISSVNYAAGRTYLDSRLSTILITNGLSIREREGKGGSGREERVLARGFHAFRAGASAHRDEQLPLDLHCFS